MTAAAPLCMARNPQVAAALAAVSRDPFPPLTNSWRDLSRDAVTRVFEDLGLRAGSRVLIVDPVSGYVPAVCAAIAATVDVVAPVAWRAGQLAEQLGSAGVGNVNLGSFLAECSDPNGRYDVIFLGQPVGKKLPPELRQCLALGGAAVLPLDDSMPSRRMLRVLRTEDGALEEDELDLSTFQPLLGDMLVESGYVLRQEIAEATRAAAQSGRLLGQELLLRGSVREDDLFRTLAAQRHLTFTDTTRVLQRLDRELVRRLPRKYLDHYKFVPVCSLEGRIVVVTSSLDLPVWELRSVFEDAEVVAELATPTDLQRVWTAIELGFVATEPQPAQASRRDDRREQVAVAPLEDSRAAGMFEAILLDAVAERASDIHLEIYDSGARLRFRVDGSLRDIGRYQFSAPDLTQVVNVVKLAGNLDIAERRMPQGGRMRRRVGGKVLDLRVQTQPTLYHENIVIRLLPQDDRPPTIEELGFPAEVANRYRRILQEPNGLVLVVGATGSGKSTTLYAGLQLLAKDTSRKVITVEDPIEFALAGIQQTQVNPAVGFHFADAMRAFVREDPDVILVGEIRDAETALETIRAAQTGHLVLATLHCNDTVDAVQRLADLGMHSNSIASELTAVIAQRLARRICTSCRAPAVPDPEISAELFGGAPPEGFLSFAGTGCDRCSGTGTRGRVAVVEFLQVDAEIRRAISRRVVLDDLREVARGTGLSSLRDSALDLVQHGVISMAELYDVLSAEQMRAPSSAAMAEPSGPSSRRTL